MVLLMALWMSLAGMIRHLHLFKISPAAMQMAADLNEK
jgi:hypothetical protein